MSDEETKPGVGQWAYLVCGTSFAIDTTALGVALYDHDGELVYSQYAPLEKAIKRGDWPETARPIAVPHYEPENWTEMVKTFERFGNAMSSIRWIEGGATLKPDVETGEWLFKRQVMGGYE